jgi:hypothetical protein
MDAEYERNNFFVDTHFSHFAMNPAFAAVIFSEEIFRDDKRLAKKIFSIMRSNFDRILVIIRNGRGNQRSGVIFMRSRS